MADPSGHSPGRQGKQNGVGQLFVRVDQRNAATLRERRARDEHQAQEDEAYTPGAQEEHVGGRYSNLESNNRASGAFAPAGKRLKYWVKIRRAATRLPRAAS